MEEKTLLNQFKKNMNSILHESSSGISLENKIKGTTEPEPPIFYEGNEFTKPKKHKTSEEYDLVEEFNGVLSIAGISSKRKIGFVRYEVGIFSPHSHKGEKYELLSIAITKPLMLKEGEIKNKLIRIEKIHDSRNTEITRKDYKKWIIPGFYKEIKQIKEIPSEWFS